MVANEFLDSLTRFQTATYVGVEDFSDKLNFLYTVIIILMCISIVTVKQYVLKPITCYISTEPGGINFLDYLENYCWVQGTIPISFNVSLPFNSRQWEELEKFKITYYQWVPFVLSIQCIMFYIPHLIWIALSNYFTGTDIQHLVITANQAVHSSEDAQQKLVLYLAKTISQLSKYKKLQSVKINKFIQWFKIRSKPTSNDQLFMKTFPPKTSVSSSTSSFTSSISYSSNCQLCSKLKLSSATAYLNCLSKLPAVLLCYISIKILYIVNAFGQLFFMQWFIGLESVWSLGWQLVYNMYHGKDYSSTSTSPIAMVFPRVAWCYVRIRHLGARDNSGVGQCALPLNMLNEHIYQFLWCWISFIDFLCVISLIKWASRLCFHWQYQIKFIKQKLYLSNSILLNNSSGNADEDRLLTKQSLTEFVKLFLGRDSLFILEMIEANAGSMIATDLIGQLWIIFKEQQRKHQEQIKCDVSDPVILQGCCHGDNKQNDHILPSSHRNRRHRRRHQNHPKRVESSAPPEHIITNVPPPPQITHNHPSSFYELSNRFYPSNNSPQHSIPNGCVKNRTLATSSPSNNLQLPDQTMFV